MKKLIFKYALYAFVIFAIYNTLIASIAPIDNKCPYLPAAREGFICDKFTATNGYQKMDCAFEKDSWCYKLAKSGE